MDDQKTADVIDDQQLDNVSSIGQRIRALRGAKNQRDFAAIVDIHKSSIGRYERGESYPDARDLTKICQKLDVDPSWLLFGGEQKSYGQKRSGRKEKYCKNCDLLMQLLTHETSMRREHEHEVKQLVTEVAKLKETVSVLAGCKNA